MPINHSLNYYYKHKKQFREYSRLRRANPARKRAEQTMARIRMWLRSKAFRDGKYPGLSKNPHADAEPLGEILACTVAEFKAWIESQFKDGMGWEDKWWHLGHRVPVRMFDCSDDDQHWACFYYKNLQPEIPAENASRVNEYVPRRRKQLGTPQA